MIKNKNKKAFTLVELMVAVSLIAVLSSVAIFGMTSIRQKAKDTGNLSELRDLQLGLEAYKSVNGKYPDTLSELVPTFKKSVPSTVQGWHYAVLNNKTYCVFLIGIINRSESQPELAADCDKSWVSCSGPEESQLNNCSTYGGEDGGTDPNLDNY